MEPASKEQLIFKLESLKELQNSGLISAGDFEREKEFLLRAFSCGSNPSGHTTQILHANIFHQAPSIPMSALSMVNTNGSIDSSGLRLALEAPNALQGQLLKVHLDQYGDLL